ncbi:MAG: YARHG domain-containing protein [Blautia sp.]|nr:YARHG domain-containing protein [Blautia sp.]
MNKCIKSFICRGVPLFCLLLCLCRICAPAAAETDSSDFVCEGSDQRVLTAEDVTDMSEEQILYAKAEIYARKGMIFADEVMNAYFSRKPWYFGFLSEENFDDSYLNTVEQQNVDFLNEMLSGEAGTETTVIIAVENTTEETTVISDPEADTTEASAASAAAEDVLIETTQTPAAVRRESRVSDDETQESTAGEAIEVIPEVTAEVSEETTETAPTPTRRESRVSDNEPKEAAAMDAIESIPEVIAEVSEETTETAPTPTRRESRISDIDPQEDAAEEALEVISEETTDAAPISNRREAALSSEEKPDQAQAFALGAAAMSAAMQSHASDDRPDVITSDDIVPSTENQAKGNTGKSDTGKDAIYSTQTTSDTDDSEPTVEAVMTDSAGTYHLTWEIDDYVILNMGSELRMDQSSGSYTEDEYEAALIRSLTGQARFLKNGKYPEGLVAFELRQINRQNLIYAQELGMSLESFISEVMGITYDNYIRDAMKQAKKNAEEDLCLIAYAKKVSNIDVTKKQYKNGVKRHAEIMGYSDTKEYKKDYSKTETVYWILKDRGLSRLKSRSSSGSRTEPVQNAAAGADPSSHPEERPVDEPVILPNGSILIGYVNASAGNTPDSPNVSAIRDPRLEYLFPEADSRYIAWNEVSSLTQQAVCYAKNEIYARHGRKFKSVELQQYFASKSWYNPTIEPELFPESVFNSYERANIDLLVQEERRKGNGALYALDRPGYDIHAVGTASYK